MPKKKKKQEEKREKEKKEFGRDENEMCFFSYPFLHQLKLIT